MGTKDQVLRMLEDQRDRQGSGARLAEELGVTRNAVWKAVEALRAEGYVIDAATNRGYRLAQENDLLSPASIERFLPDGHPFGITVRKRVDSTNAEARRRALEGAPEGAVVVAEEQTAGRGRLGKTFYSPWCCALGCRPTPRSTSPARPPYPVRRPSRPSPARRPSSSG